MLSVPVLLVVIMAEAWELKFGASNPPLGVSPGSMNILSFPSCDTSCWLCSSRILILDSSLSLCSLSILASFRISASEEEPGCAAPVEDEEDPLLWTPEEELPEPEEAEADAFRCC